MKFESIFQAEIPLIVDIQQIDQTENFVWITIKTKEDRIIFKEELPTEHGINEPFFVDEITANLTGDSLPSQDDIIRLINQIKVRLGEFNKSTIEELIQ